MPIFRQDDAVEHKAHGSTFRSYVTPSRGSAQLCAWRLKVPAGLRGVAHRPSHEEVLLVLDGDLQITLDGAPAQLAAGDVALVPAGSQLRVDGGASAATAWVTTTPGLQALTADGTRITPPWAN